MLSHNLCYNVCYTVLRCATFPLCACPDVAPRTATERRDRRRRRDRQRSLIEEQESISKILNSETSQGSETSDYYSLPSQQMSSETSVTSSSQSVTSSSSSVSTDSTPTMEYQPTYPYTAESAASSRQQYSRPGSSSSQCNTPRYPYRTEPTDSTAYPYTSESTRTTEPTETTYPYTRASSQSSYPYTPTSASSSSSPHQSYPYQGNSNTSQPTYPYTSDSSQSMYTYKNSEGSSEYPSTSDSSNYPYPGDSQSQSTYSYAKDTSQPMYPYSGDSSTYPYTGAESRLPSETTTPSYPYSEGQESGQGPKQAWESGKGHKQAWESPPRPRRRDQSYNSQASDTDARDYVHRSHGVPSEPEQRTEIDGRLRQDSSSQMYYSSSSPALSNVLDSANDANQRAPTPPATSYKTQFSFDQANDEPSESNTDQYDRRREQDLRSPQCAMDTVQGQDRAKLRITLQKQLAARLSAPPSAIKRDGDDVSIESTTSTLSNASSSTSGVYTDSSNLSTQSDASSIKPSSLSSSSDAEHWGKFWGIILNARDIHHRLIFNNLICVHGFLCSCLRMNDFAEILTLIILAHN